MDGCSYSIAIELSRNSLFSDYCFFVKECDTEGFKSHPSQETNPLCSILLDCPAVTILKFLRWGIGGIECCNSWGQTSPDGFSREGVNSSGLACMRPWVLSPARQIRGEKRKQVGEDACSQAYNWDVPGGCGKPLLSAVVDSVLCNCRVSPQSQVWARSICICSLWRWEGSVSCSHRWTMEKSPPSYWSGRCVPVTSQGSMVGCVVG